MRPLDNETITFLMLVVASAPFAIRFISKIRREGTPEVWAIFGRQNPTFVRLVAYFWGVLIVISAVQLMIHFGFLGSGAMSSLDQILGPAIALPGLVFMYVSARFLLRTIRSFATSLIAFAKFSWSTSKDR